MLTKGCENCLNDSPVQTIKSSENGEVLCVSFGDGTFVVFDAYKSQLLGVQKGSLLMFCGFMVLREFRSCKPGAVEFSEQEPVLLSLERWALQSVDSERRTLLLAGT
jgi:hypothetical protein